MKKISKLKNLGSAPSVVDGPSIIEIPPQPDLIRELFIFSQKQTSVQFANLTDNKPLVEFQKIVVKTDVSEWTLSGPFLTEISSTFGIYLSQLVAVANDNYHYVPPRVVKLQTPIWPGQRIRVEIYTNSAEILGGTTANGDFLYIVKSRSETNIPVNQILWTATTTQREFAVGELSELGEKSIPIRNDSRLVKYVGILVEKKNGSWTPITDSTDFGDLIVQAGNQTLYNDNFQTLRTISHSQLKSVNKFPNGVIVLRLLPRDFPDDLIYDAILGPNSIDLKISIRGRSINTVEYRLTVSVIAYDQLIPSGRKINKK